MLTIQDCVELSGLSEEEILAIAQHEHVPEMIAVELRGYRVQTPAGKKRIKAMIVDDMRAQAVGRGSLLPLQIAASRFELDRSRAAKPSIVGAART